MPEYDTTREQEDEPVFPFREWLDDDPNFRAAAVQTEANYAYEDEYV